VALNGSPADALSGSILPGKLRYQACHNTMCFPPKTEDVKLPTEIQQRGRGGRPAWNRLDRISTRIVVAGRRGSVTRLHRREQIGAGSRHAHIVRPYNPQRQNMSSLDATRLLAAGMPDEHRTVVLQTGYFEIRHFPLIVPAP